MDFSQGFLDTSKTLHNCISRSSCLQMFYKGRPSKKFWKIHRNTPVLELLCNQVPGLQYATFFILKKRIQHKSLPINFAKFYKHLFYIKTFGRLHIDYSVNYSMKFHKYNKAKHLLNLCKINLILNKTT